MALLDMRVRDNWERLSIATLLLCLFAAFAVSPPEYHRANSGQRSRTVRAIRVDDHDHDHALGAPNLAFDLDTSKGNDRPVFEALFPPGNPPGLALAYAGRVLTQPPTPIFSAFLPSTPGRSPPSF